jgi:hypothetical protein
VLPSTKQIGEASINDLNVLLLDELENALCIECHDLSPLMFLCVCFVRRVTHDTTRIVAVAARSLSCFVD